MIPLRSDALIYAMLWELILVPLPSVPVETPGSTCFPGHWRSNFFGHSEIIGPRKTCRPRSLLSRWLFIEGVLIYIPAWSWDWDGSITGLHSKNLGVIGLTGGSGKDVFCYLAMKIDNVTIVTTCRDIVMFFRVMVIATADLFQDIEC